MPASVALAARADLRERAVPVMRNRYIAGALMFELLIAWPLGIYLYALHRDWSWMYLRIGRTLPELLAGRPAHRLGWSTGHLPAHHIRKCDDHQDRETRHDRAGIAHAKGDLLPLAVN